ncbi:MAG: hypothetical protein KBA81_01195 [Rhabdochlamydiaceae bacterium]|nr:hypothetical protein [Rhabdochlamydiaceae bacterium]
MEAAAPFDPLTYMNTFRPVSKPSASLEIIKRISFFVMGLFAAICPPLRVHLLNRLFPVFEVVLVRDSDQDLKTAEQFLESMRILNSKIEVMSQIQAKTADFTGKRVLMICPSSVSATELDFDGTVSDTIRKKCMDVSAKYLFLHQGHWNTVVMKGAASDFIKNLNLFATEAKQHKNYFDAVIENWKQPFQA